MATKNLKNGDTEPVVSKDSNLFPVIQPSSLLDREKAALVSNGPHPGQPDKNVTNGSAYRQIMASIVAQLGTVNTGMVFGFSAIAVPQLQESDSTIPITTSQGSWIASMSSIGTPIGCILSGYMMDSIGRKRSLIITEVPALIGWLLISFAQDVQVIYAGRFLIGLGSGMVGAPARVYTSEITQPHLRGMLIAFASVGVSTGVLIEYTMGSVLKWNICAGISAVLPLVALLLMFIFPETPSFLVSRNEPDQARKALKQIRSSNYNLQPEMDTLLNYKNDNNIQRLTGAREILRALIKPNAMKPFLILFFYFLIYQWSGTNAVTFYAVEVFQDSGATIDKYLATVVLGVVRLVFTIVACALCKKVGRRPLTMLSACGCGVSMFGLGGYMWLKTYWDNANIAPVWTWFPVACIFSYTICCTLGFLVVPWIMMGEVYPVQVRGLLGGLTNMSTHTFIFLVVKTYPLLADLITRHGTFLLYGCISMLGSIYFYIWLPETQDKTLQEIEDYFSGRDSNLKTGSIRRNKPNVLTIPKGEMMP